jgi:zinc D-Ala-D-Ala carboxypeptidase
MTLYTHWREAPSAAWRWPNFSPAEIACRGSGKLLVNEAALDKLQALRTRLGKPLIIRSAYRSPEHNRAVGGAKASKHMEGIAFDVAMANHDPEAFEATARAVDSRASVSTRARASSISISGRRGAGAGASPSA